MDLSQSATIDPDYLDTSSQTGIEDYICCICQLIPYPETALEEENCGHLFCNACINSWLKRDNKCPFCKSEISTRLIKDKNKIVYRHLINLVILCQEDNCSWKGICKDYFEHLKNVHKKYTKENLYNENIHLNFELYKYYKAAIHEHPLKYLDTTMDAKWICDASDLQCGCLSGSNNINLSKNFKRFRCMQCNYDLCEKCMIKYYDDKAIIKNDNSNNRNLYLFKKPYYSLAHEHPLIFLDKSSENGWACDGRNLIKKCFSGITDFNQTKGIPRFRCEICDFDLCENCMNYYRKKKFYEINKGYIVNCHSHPLIYKGITNNGWACDGKNLKEKCFSGINDFRQTNGMENFRCDKCDFDLCGNCMDYYLKDKSKCVIF